MPKVCSYGLCKNGQNRSDCRFFKFPSAQRDPERRRLWAVRCNRKNSDGRTWEPNTEYVFVCSDHFVTGEPWIAKNHPDYAPSISCRNVDSEETQKATKAMKRFTMALNRTLRSTRPPTTSAIRNVNMASTNSEDTSIKTICSPMETNTDDTLSLPSTTMCDTQVDVTITNFTVNSLILHDFIFSSKNSKITFITITDEINPQIKKSVVFDVNFKPWVHVFGKLVNDGNYFWKHLTPKFNCLKNIQSLLDSLHSASVCSGIDSPKLISSTILKHSKLAFCSDEQGGRVRSINCDLLTCSGTICAKCIRLKKSLLMRKLRSEQQSSHQDMTHSQRPNKTLSSPLRLAKLAQLAHRNKRHGMEIASLKLKLERNRKYCASLIAVSGEKLNSIDTETLVQLASECKSTVLEQFPKGSFQRIFFEQQIQYNQLREKSSMRWHPAIIRWCLFLRSKSSKAYDGIRSVLSLPSNRTLYDYTHYTEHGIGINPKTVEQLISVASQLDCYSKPYNSFVGLLQDEIKIKSDLVYHKNTGELIGFVNLDNVANEILNLEHLKGSSKPLAEHMLVIMVRGITTSLCYPLASYATKLLTGSTLYTVMWESIECVEVVAGLRVLYICCDGAVQNRKLFQLLTQGDEASNKVKNLYAPDNREIYFISDPPHLLKTARNCFANSFAHSNTRRMWFNHDISWSHVVRLYEEHCYQSQFRLCPKLKKDHIELTSFSKIRVSLAAQVLSATVANALDLAYGDSVKSTAHFIRIMNSWFDIVNVKNVFEGRNTRNANLDPFTDSNDPRLLWLETEFLDYFNNWKIAVDTRPGTFSPKEKQQMQLSPQTLHGLQITSRSIAAMVRIVLDAGAPFVLTSHFNQDPLEQFFGHCRHKGGSNDNPTIDEACHAINTIRTVNTQAVPSSHGNTKPIPNILDMTPVPKRSSHIHLM